MSTRPFVTVVLGGLALASCSESTGNGRPLVLITLDTTRSDFLGCYGRAGDPTPNFDALAAEGVRCALALSTSAVTPVSHASILSGLYPYEHGLRVLLGDGGYRMRRDVPTLAAVLKDAGYSTAAIHSAFPVSGFFGFDHGFDVFESFDVTFEERSGQSVGWDTTSSQRRSDVTTDMAIEVLASVEPPFFLWIHYWDPHDPLIQPPPEDIPEGTPRDTANTELYAAEVSYVDRQFGRLVAELERRGLYDECVIAVVADHGEGLDDGLARHGWKMHRELYQEQIHVPLILKAPDAPRGAVVEQVVSTVDLYPTLLDHLGLEPPEPVSGTPLRILLEGSARPGRVVYADQVNRWDRNASMLQQRPQADFVHSASDGEWKLLYRPTHLEASELFHLSVDPQELHNLFADEGARPERVRLLMDLAARQPWVTEPPPPITGTDASAAGAQLTALGYTSDDGAPIEIRWEWFCPEHEGRDPRPGTCETCGTALVPIGRYVE